MPSRATLLSQSILVGLVGLASVAAINHPRADDLPDLKTVNSVPENPVTRRILAKSEVTAALLRGEITLGEATCRFGQLNGDDPAPVALLRADYPSAGDEELACRQVLQFALGQLQTTVSRHSDRLTTLHAEFLSRFPSAAPMRGWASRARRG